MSAAYFQKPLHFAIFVPILIVMLSRRILLPRYKNSFSKAQTLCNVLDIPVAAWNTNSATQQLSNSATQQLSNSATQQLSNSATQQLDCALINGQLLHSANNIIIFSHQFLQTAQAVLVFLLLHKNGTLLPWAYCVR